MKCAAVIVENREFDMDSIIDRHKKFLPSSWEIIHLKDVIVSHFHEYNRLLGSAKFWKSLPFDKVLIFQHDSGLLRKGIEDFLKYDYVGAPWVFQESGGNGGLSLRTPEVMIRTTEFLAYDRSHHGNEDVYFSNNIKWVGGKLAPRKACSEFSVESVFQMGTLGYHAIDNFFSKDVVNKILTQYDV